MTIAPENRRLLGLVPHARGKRSPITCLLKCGDQCAHETPNTSDNEYFPDVATRALSRRGVLGGVGAGALALAVAPATPAAAGTVAAAPAGRGNGLRFSPIAPVPATVDALTVPEGYTWKALVRLKQEGRVRSVLARSLRIRATRRHRGISTSRSSTERASAHLRLRCSARTLPTISSSTLTAPTCCWWPP